MASLIFWGPILTHKAVISHRREKQRVKNYERWEGLRDDYDEQRRVARESRSLDIQRTGSWDSQQSSPVPPPLEETRSYINQRDQQEANDARTGWRPQECWDGPKTQLQAQMTGQVQQYQRPHMPPQQHVSMTPTVVPQMTGTQSPTLPLRSQKTGATWDDGLPAPLAVSRQSFDDYDHSRRYRSPNTQSMPVSRDNSLTRQQTSYFSPPPGQPQPQPTTTVSRQNSVSRNMSRQASISRTQTPSGLRESTTPALYSLPSETQVTQVVELPKNEFGFVDPTRMVAGGRMAELIERGY